MKNAKIWKKNAVLATVILFVCVAVYLNWSYGRDTAAVAEASPSPTAAGTRVSGETGGGTVELSSSGASSEPASDPSADVTEADAPAENEYFAEARLNREQARASSIEILRESGGMETASQEARDESIAAANLIASNALKEAEIEGLVMAKGFSDCVAYISDGAIDVIVAAPEGGLVSEQVSQIKDIVLSKTDIPLENVRIVGA